MAYMDEYKRWLESDCVDEATKEELRSIAGNDAEIKNRFEGMLEFGTAGLRGIMRAGLNGMNVYTVRYATQGFADAIKASGENLGSGVSIAYDCRNNSELFAHEAASVLAGNGIHVNIFDELRPTPELSFTIRYLESIAGINITASHNTKEYNGYKAYWSDGAQLSPENADMVAAAIAKTDIFNGIKWMDFDDAVKAGLVTILGKEIDEEYLSRVMAQSVGKKYVDAVADNFEIMYTPFHGCGYKLVPEALRRLGMKHVTFVKEQMVIDGNFPTVKSPNPENVEGFELAIKQAKEKGIDLIIGTDPDSDRCGIAVKNGDDYETLTGNQIGVMLLDYLITVRREQGTLPANAGAIKSIVSTTMANKVCADNGVFLAETFTGFKYIGGKVTEFEETGDHTFIFGFEESIGFLAGNYARDKDAVVAAMLIAEMACWYKSRGMNLYEGMQSLYEKYGDFREKTISIVYSGFDAKERMSAVMANIRKKIPEKIYLPVKRVRDYQSRVVTDMVTGETSETDQEGTSNVVFFELDENCVCVVRPSGTEPKIKVYLMTEGKDAADAEEKLAGIIEASKELLS